ncbi:hypothetical protein CEP52_001163 [Fusarium oligoseptatum]|uniref:HNH nuclease domain-containing protein n=1 Tax=Fusarium oligoseptatum TaxID=2604345 RepID=A0A428UK88_9HYPO|nr:hypothetical protein CEP52_001163 [Fusarium oligoseptatum]
MSLNPADDFQEPGPLLPLREAEIRRDFAIQLEAAIRANPIYSDFRLNAVQVATILYVPLCTFRLGGYLSLQDSGGQPNNEGTLRARLIAMLEPVDHFLSPGSEDDEAADDEQPEPSSTPKKRNKTQSKNCRIRDKAACVLMGTNDPHVCHIIPFSWNNSYENLEKTSGVFFHAEAFLSRVWMKQFGGSIQNPRVLASSDKTWNMICLNMQMHAYWREARFGLECLGYRPGAEGESVVTLQFNWMPRSAMKPTDEMNLQGKDSDFDRMVNSVESFWQGGSIPTSAELGQIKSGVPLISGHLIEIEMPSSDAPLFKAMIDFQWAMVVVAALSGAADDEDSFDTYLRTMEWVEEQKSRNAARHRGVREQTPRSI